MASPSAEINKEEEDLQMLKEAALTYLDQTSQLTDFRVKCDEYVHNNENVGVYLFTVDVNPSHISQVDASLADVVLHNPKMAKKIFQQVCYTTVQCLSLLPDDTKSSQVIVKLKVTHLPSFNSYDIRPHNLPACQFDSRFYKFDGIVVSMTTPTEYSQVAKYRCPVTDCHGATDNQYIRLHTAGAKETHTIRRDFHCVYCGSTLIEDVNCRVLGEKLVVEMIESEAFSTENNYPGNTFATYNQSITVFLRDDLMANIQIGEHYTVIGIPIKQMMENAKVSVSFEANNIVQTKTTFIPTLSIDIPSSIEELYKDRRSSPWTFSASLAYLFGGDIVPPGTYHKLKLIMLLSLVNSMDKTKDANGRFNLLITGRDTLAIDRLLQYGASFADRCIRHSAGLPLMAAVNKDGHGTGACSIDGGSLLLAHHGVCLLGDVARFKKDVITKLYQVMESGRILVEIPKKYNNQSLQHLTLPVECSIWAYADCKTYKNTPLDVFAPMEPSKSSVSLLEECFSLLVSCSSTDRSKDDYAEHCLIHDTLMAAIVMEEEEDVSHKDDQDEYVIHRDDLRQFLQHVSASQVELSVAARRLIKGYFVASRRVRSSGVHGTPFPQSALQTLSQLSKAHAKLNLNTEVSEQDAVLAILLYEEMVTERFGYSVLSIQPRPHFRDDNIDAYIGPQNDVYMQQFRTLLIRFCTSHAPEFEVFESES